MLDDAFSEILPAGESFRVGWVWGGGKDVRGTEVRAETLGDDGPAHEFRDGEGFEEGLFFGDEGVAGVGVDAVEEVGLFVVVGGEEDEEDYSLEDLRAVRRFFLSNEGSGCGLLRGVDVEFLPPILCLELAGNVCIHRGIYPHALREEFAVRNIVASNL